MPSWAVKPAGHAVERLSAKPTRCHPVGTASQLAGLPVHPPVPVLLDVEVPVLADALTLADVEALVLADADDIDAVEPPAPPGPAVELAGPPGPTEELPAPPGPPLELAAELLAPPRPLVLNAHAASSAASSGAANRREGIQAQCAHSFQRASRRSTPTRPEAGRGEGWRRQAKGGHRCGCVSERGRRWKEPMRSRVDLLVMSESTKKPRGKAVAGADVGAIDPPRPATVLVAFRVPQALAERLDRLAAELSTPWHEMKRSEVARAAMERGLDALEQEAAERRRTE